MVLLLPLKRCLRELDIADNPAIGDDAMVVLTMFHKLLYLAFGGTGVSMTGVRRLVTTMELCGHDMDIEIPDACEQYLRSEFFVDVLAYMLTGEFSDMVEIHHKYILSIDPPLVSDPRTVPNLTTPVIIQNLTAHSAVNPDIPTQGPRGFLVKQLEDILQAREADIKVRRLINLG